MGQKLMEIQISRFYFQSAGQKVFTEIFVRYFYRFFVFLFWFDNRNITLRQEGPEELFIERERPDMRDAPQNRARPWRVWTEYYHLYK